MCLGFGENLIDLFPKPLNNTTIGYKVGSGSKKEIEFYTNFGKI
jgi:hypothetical protein